MGERILITGGTGSFGQAMTRWLLDNDHTIRINSVPSIEEKMELEKQRGKLKDKFVTVCILSRDQHKQELMERRLKESGYDLNQVRFFIGDVRDRRRLYRAVKNVTYVIHAAAMKIIPSCEYNVSECIQTNIIGTENVVEVCAQSDTVKKFLLISTDKAVLPINVYGRCKAVAENITTMADYNYGSPQCEFVTIRLGNVISSNGSVIPLFSKLKNEKKPIPVTDRNMTRFFIPLSEVTKFAWDAIQYGGTGRILIPWMKAARISLLARKFGSVKIIGIRPGEKIHEDIISPHEMPRTANLGEMGKKWIIYPEALEKDVRIPAPVRSCDVKWWNLDKLIKIGTGNGHH